MIFIVDKFRYQEINRQQPPPLPLNFVRNLGGGLLTPPPDPPLRNAGLTQSTSRGLQKKIGNRVPILSILPCKTLILKVQNRKNFRLRRGFLLCKIDVYGPPKAREKTGFGTRNHRFLKGKWLSGGLKIGANRTSDPEIPEIDLRSQR